MVGILIATHGNLGEELVKTVEVISGPQSQMAGVAVGQKDDMPTAAKIIEKAFHQVNLGEGVIIFTDLLGGTPSNLCLTFLNRPDVEVISGVNLPMLLKAVSLRGKKPLREIVEPACLSGRGGIAAASSMLEKSAERHEPAVGQG